MAKIMRVNMSDLKISVEEMPKEYQGLGGRGLTSVLISKEVPPTCHPLGEKNKLVFAAGSLSGTSAANNSRLSVGLKSPLTGGIKESNAGGTSAFKLGRLGLNIVVEGIRKDGKWYILHVTKEGGKLTPADEYQGLKNYELVKKLQSRFGEKVGILSIGPAGEMKLSTATIASTDTSGIPCRHAGRGGPGAVMGSKGLKAIVIDDTGAPGVPIAHMEKFREGAKKFAKAIQNHPLTGQGLKILGTNMLVNPLNAAGAYPTRNFREGTFEGVDKVSGEYMHEVITKRGGNPSHAGCTTCIIQCSNVYVDEKGEYITSSFEYETIWANGANLGISDLDTIARIDRLCDEYGIDTMEIGAAIGVAMDAGIKKFGDAKGAMELIEEVGKGTPLGRILGSGSWVTGKVFGIARVPAVKRQGMAAYEPRALHGMGVSYATSTMGADHTAGWVVNQNIAAMGGKLDPHKAEGQVDASRMVQILTAAMDCTGLCTFVNFPVGDVPEGGQGLMEMMSALYGVDMTFDNVVELGKMVLKTEREFNLAAGFTKADDRLPDFMIEEKIPPHNVSFTVPDKELDRFFEF
ncbi:MAG TPA: aldehyde ferredoxin oxidoreductase C-terminal domain-containing protein [Thermodesulfobacteriota bacterium]|nr:aldehyde ferredoxin oxidoreductase C-terminal domain-containing protein [Thermodesulfobacteriota bacterium]